MVPLALAVACATTSVPVTERCDVEVLDLSPAEGRPGDAVVVTGRPFTTTFDTAAYIAGQRAVVASVDRTDCAACDTCRTRNTCTVCDDCDDCATECTVTCIETMTLEVPPAEAGQADLRIYNAHGESPPAAFSVLGRPDSGTIDSGTSDSGAPDSGIPDTGAPDTATP